MSVSERGDRVDTADAAQAARAPRAPGASGTRGSRILIALLDRPYRFSELRREVGRRGRGVSEKMLAQTLQTLQRDGLVHRDARPVIPPRVDYSLTGLGREAAEQVRALARWTERRMPDVERARRAYDEARALSSRAS
jgi:DNA-binding HxlR family transcriptional regulator